MEKSNNSQLKHHGILGMKWGVRRYQNKDGSLTAAGKKRLKNGENDDADSTKASGNKKGGSSSKSVKDMTDAELREKIARLEMEKRYRDLSKNEQSTSKAKKFITEQALPKFGNTLVNVANDYASKKLKEALGLNDSDPLKDLRKKVDKLDLEKRLKNLTDEDAKKDDELRRKVQRLVLEEQYDKYEKKKKKEEDE